MPINQWVVNPMAVDRLVQLGNKATICFSSAPLW